MFWFGAILSFSYPAYAPYHVAMVAIVIAVNRLRHGSCTLTDWEQRLLVLGGRREYGSSCYNQYIFSRLLHRPLTGRQILRLILLL